MRPMNRGLVVWGAEAAGLGTTLNKSLANASTCADEFSIASALQRFQTLQRVQQLVVNLGHARL